MREKRKLVFRVASDARSIDFEQTFIAIDGDVIFEDRKDAGLSIRVPVSMAVDSHQGGSIVNSESQTNAQAWSQPAKWCDYHGPVDGEVLGIAFLNHPDSFRFPTRWHVRQYGLFTANPFAIRAFDKNLKDGSFVLMKDRTMNLKHRLIFHLGNAKAAKIETAWHEYATEKNENEQK